MRSRKTKEERWTWKEIVANVMIAAMFVGMIIFVVMVVKGNGPATETANIMHEYTYAEAIENDEAEQLPEDAPDLSMYETYDPLKGYLGMASGFGGLYYFLKKRDKKLDSIDKKQDKIDNRLSVIESKVDRNIDDIQSVRDDLQDADRIEKIMSARKKDG